MGSNLESSVSSKAQDKVAEQIREMYETIQSKHAQAVAHAFGSTTPAEKRVFDGKDLFANLYGTSSRVTEQNGTAMRIKAKVCTRGTACWLLERRLTCSSNI